jgi:hypothetical protein
MALILVTAGLAACSQTEARDQPDTWGPETAAYDAASGGVETAAADGVTDRFTSTPSSSQASRFPEPFGNSYWSGDLDLRYASAEGFAGFGFEQAAIGQQSVSHNDHSIRAQGQPDAPQIDLALGLDDSMNRNGNGNIQEPLQLAAASTEGAGATKSAECAAFEQDIDADLGEILRAGCQPTLAQMSALMDNPLGNVAMLFTQFDLYRMENPTNGKTANKGNYMGIAQFPKAVNEDWNLINRVIWTVPSMPLDQDKIDRAADRARRTIGSGEGGAVLPPSLGGAAPIDLFDGRTTGFGDMYYVGLFAPKKGTDMGNGKFLWGAGFDLGIPTATEDILGTGKWTAGPSALGVYMGPKWKVGALVTQYWDFAGDDDRDDVNMTNLQYFVYYSLNETTSIGASPNIIANWEQNSDNAFTVPIGLGISKTIQFGKVPVRLGAEFHYSVVQPDDVVGTEWDFRFYIIPAAPSALFEWMTKPIFGG